MGRTDARKVEIALKELAVSGRQPDARRRRQGDIRLSRERNLVLFTLSGLFKEAGWFHSIFVAGNYPLLLSQIRFVWESMFRAYFAEHYPMEQLRRPKVPRSCCKLE